MTAIITIAPTGPAATKADNPAMATQPDEIAAAVHSAYELGASVAHLHFRDKDERPSADLGIGRQTIDLIRERCPIIIQVSTGVGGGVEFAKRAALVELRPEMATLNPCTMSFAGGVFDNPPADVERLAGRMMELGITPEVELYDVGHLEFALRLRDKGLIPAKMRVSIVLGVAGGLSASVENLVMMAGRLPADTVWQSVVIGRHNLPLSMVAAAMGGNVRAGMEDVLHLRKGELASSNDQLVERVAAVLRHLERPIAGVDQAREILFGGA